jgi:predicted flap endonuclease-1-like 5' DNA nuclease
MSFLYRIVYAAHANGTHHKLALDALGRVQGPHAERWQNLFLKHAKAYLEGSKAPDTKFKDFKNHVLHVRDDYWGGAPEKAQEWYGRLQGALRSGAWSEAVYAAGVLSHYYTDPIHPFHTAQTEAESAIHRACEWSISRSYDELAALGCERFSHIEVAVPDGAHWLKDMVCRGAEISNRQYERLIAHYDIHRGVADPPGGLDATAQALVAELIAYATAGFARVLERAFAESGVTPPEVSLTAEAFLATLQIPQKWVEKKLSNAADRTLVLSMYHELQATGRVEATLPEDDRAIRDLHAKEIAEPRAAKQTAARAKRLSVPDPAAPEPRVAAAPATSIAPASAAAVARVFLKSSDDLEAAPSIGPRSAQWFGEAGIFTVGDFLAANPVATAKALAAHGIAPETIRLWQQQARLVMDVPGLRGTHAQLLAGAGYHDAAAVAAADAATLCAAILRFAASAEGQRILRQGEAPATDKIKGWIASAAACIAA